MGAQLSLPVSLREDATFANFLAVEETRRQAVAHLTAGGSAGTALTYLWGAPGSGVSHLMQAACHHYADLGRSSQYLPLGELVDLDAEGLLEGLEQQSLVCLEDIHSVAGSPAWERGLFNLYNRMTALGHLLLVTANAPPAGLRMALPDLVSRLSAGLVFQLPTYSDDEKQQIIRFRSARLGLEMSEEVAGFLFSRYSRNLDDLMALLGKLDIASLESKRRLTIPFVKQALEAESR